MSANKLPPITVRGTVYWCERSKLNKYSNKYQVQLGNLSEKAVEALEEMGIAPSNKGDEREFFITMKSNNPMRLTDADGVEIPEDVLIANGSEAVAVVGYYDWSVGTGRSPSMIKMKITNLIEYADNSVSEAEAL
jgi:glutamine synthetase